MMEIKERFRADSKLKLMDQVRQVLRYHHYAYQMEKTYCDWIVCYIRFHGSKNSQKTWRKVKSFLSHLAANRNVSASTQRQPYRPAFLCSRFGALPTSRHGRCARSGLCTDSLLFLQDIFQHLIVVEGRHDTGTGKSFPGGLQHLAGIAVAGPDRVLGLMHLFP